MLITMDAYRVNCAYPFSFVQVVSTMEVWTFHVCDIFLSSIHGLRVLPHMGYMGKARPKGYLFMMVEYEKSYGREGNLYFK